MRCVPASQTRAVTIAATMSRSTGELLPGPVGCRIGWKMTARTRVMTAARWALPRAGGPGAFCGGFASRVIVIVIERRPVRRRNSSRWFRANSS